MSTRTAKSMSLEEFLAWEETQDARYEFVDGRIVAMTGGTQIHDLIRGAIYGALLRQLAGKPCRPLLDVILICPSGRTRYADVAVDCAPLARTSSTIGKPTLVVEVLSPSTRSTDYLEKPRDYGSVPSIEVYLIVDPDEPRIDVLRRTASGLELAEQVQGRDAVIGLSMIDATLALADIYPV